MPYPTPLPDVLARAPFTVAQAYRLGVSRDRLRSSLVRAPFRGVRVPSQLPDDLDTAARALALLLPDLVLEGVTACAWHGLPLLAGINPRAPLMVATSTRARVAGVRARVCAPPPGAGRTRTAYRVLSRPSAWASAANDPRLGGAELLILADALCSAPDVGVPIEHVRAAVDGHTRPPRLELANRVLALASPRVDSPQESRLRWYLFCAQFPPPLVNADQYRADGSFLARPDLCWPEVKVAVEYDGAVHLDSRQWRKDLVRREAMEADGWRIIVVIAADLYNPEQVCRRVARALLARGLRWPGCQRWSNEALTIGSSGGRQTAG